MKTTPLTLHHVAPTGLFALLLVMSGLAACGSTGTTTSGGAGATSTPLAAQCDEGCRALHRMPSTSECDEGARALARMGIAATCRND